MFSWTGPITGLELTHYAQVAGQQAPGICGSPSSPPPLCVYASETSGEDVGCQALPLSLSYSIKTEPLTGPGALSPTCSTRLTGTCATTCSFLHGWVLETQIQFSRLGRQGLLPTKLPSEKQCMFSSDKTITSGVPVINS